MIPSRAVIGLWSISLNSFRVLVILSGQVLVVKRLGNKILSVVSLVNAICEIGGLEGEVICRSWLCFHLLSFGGLCSHFAIILQF